MSAAAVAAIAIGIVLNMRRQTQDDLDGDGEETWICPSATFWLSEEQVSSFESSALLEGNVVAAVRLELYHAIACAMPRMGDVWKYRAAQLGDFSAACDLHTRGLLDELPQIFSEEVLSNSVDATMSDLAREYIHFNYRNCRETHADSSGSSVVCSTNDWSLETATVKAGKVVVRNGEWKIRYAAYKARDRYGNSCETNQVQVLVFPSMSLIDSGLPADINMSGIACQHAVFMAESNGWPWIVVAVNIKSSLIPETLEITDYEKDNCARIALERVFAEFSLPPSTVVMPAGDVLFVDRFKKLIESDYKVRPAPEKLLVYGEQRRK